MPALSASRVINATTSGSSPQSTAPSAGAHLRTLPRRRTSSNLNAGRARGGWRLLAAGLSRLCTLPHATRRRRGSHYSTLGVQIRIR